MVAGTKGTRSRRIAKTVTVSKTGVEVVSCYCRKCMKNMPPEKFFTRTDNFLDSNGYFSVCKDCINELYNKIYEFETHNVEQAILKTCRIMNIRYSPEAVIAMQRHVETMKSRGKNETENTFGLYKAKLMMTQKSKISDRDKDEDFTFYEPEPEIMEAIAYDPIDDQAYFEDCWGPGLSPDDYEYLEKEFAKWKRTTKCDTQGEEILVRELCHKQNDIRKARVEGKSVDSLVKALQEIMKNSSLTPALQNAASAGKSAETFGVWIRDIESLSPAEWWQDQEKYKDMDDMSQDIKDIKSSIGTYITGSRDYNTTDLEEINESEFESSDTGG